MAMSGSAQVSVDPVRLSPAGNGCTIAPNGSTWDRSSVAVPPTIATPLSWAAVSV